jgi:transposase
MSKIRKNHSKQTKFKAVLELIKSEKTVMQICQEYSTCKSALHRWKQTFLKDGPQIFDNNTTSTKLIESNQTNDLERKIGQLIMENDFLKKALGQ